jgi:hypothetical protein
MEKGPPEPPKEIVEEVSNQLEKGKEEEDLSKPPEKDKDEKVPDENAADERNNSEKEEKEEEEEDVVTKKEEEEQENLSQIGSKLNSMLDRADCSSINQTVISVAAAESWTRQDWGDGFLAQCRETALGSELQRAEKNKVFDFLEVISNGGISPFEEGAALHVIVAAVHSYQQSIVETVVQENKDPISEMEREWDVFTSVIGGE